MCGADNEDILHFYQCNKYLGQIITDMVHIDNDIEVIWPWLLHVDRHSDIRVQVSQWIHSRWKIRARNLAAHRNDDRIPAITDKRKKRIVEPGTAKPLQNSKKPKTEIQERMRPVRRGPTRACKIKSQEDIEDTR